MAKIPDFQELGPPPSPQPSTAIVPIQEDQTANALQGVGEAVSAIDAHLTDARRASDLTGALAAATQQLGEKEIAYKRDPDFATIPKRFTQDASDIGANIGATIQDGVTQRVFQQEYQKLTAGKQLAVMQNAANNEADFNKGKLRDGLETVAQQAAFATNDLDRANNANFAKIMIGEMESARWITHVEAQEFQQKFLQRTQEIGVMHDIDADPVGTYKRLQADPGYLPNMDPLVRARFEHWAKSAAMPNEAKQDAMLAMKPSAATNFQEAAPAGGEPLVQRVRLVESGGDPNAVSPAGAKGAMQVLDSTNYNPGFGVVPAANNSSEERERVGRDYLQAMVARYGGNETLATAAYNAGPGKVDDWIAKYGDPRSGAISDAEFTSKIPFAETRSYVQRVASPITQARGIPSTAIDVRANLGQWISNAEASAEQSHPGDAVYRDMVVGNVRNYVATIAATEEGQQRQALSYLTGKLTPTTGPKPTSQDELFADPTSRTAFARLDASAQSGVLNHLEMNARAAAMLEARSAPGLYNDVVKRMYLPDSDPQKITSPVQLVAMLRADGTGLSTADLDRGERELVNATTPEGAAFQKDKAHYMGLATRMMASGITGKTMMEAEPEKFLDAGDRLQSDFEKAVAAARTANKDPRQLMLHDSPDYFFTPSRVMSYLGTPQQAVAGAAAKAPVDPADAIAQAKVALAKNVPRDAVIKRLQQAGVDPALLDQAAPAPKAAAPQTSPANAAFERETREIETGTRPTYSPETIAAVQAETAARSAARDEEDRRFADRQRALDLARSREIARSERPF